MRGRSADVSYLRATLGGPVTEDMLREYDATATERFR